MLMPYIFSIYTINMGVLPDINTQAYCRLKTKPKACCMQAIYCQHYFEYNKYA